MLLSTQSRFARALLRDPALALSLVRWDLALPLLPLQNRQLLTLLLANEGNPTLALCLRFLRQLILLQRRRRQALLRLPSRERSLDLVLLLALLLLLLVETTEMSAIHMLGDHLALALVQFLLVHFPQEIVRLKVSISTSSDSSLVLLVLAGVVSAAELRRKALHRHSLLVKSLNLGLDLDLLAIRLLLLLQSTMGTVVMKSQSPKS